MYAGKNPFNANLLLWLKNIRWVKNTAVQISNHKTKDWYDYVLGLYFYTSTKINMPEVARGSEIKNIVIYILQSHNT